MQAGISSSGRRRRASIITWRQRQMTRSLPPRSLLEPSNARTLMVSVDRARALGAAYDRINAAPPLREPVLRTALVAFNPEIIISTTLAVYGLAGLVIGSFVAQLTISTLNVLAYLKRARGLAEK